MQDRFKFRVWDRIHKKYIYCDFVGFCSVDKSGKGLKKIIFRPSGVDQLLNEGKIFYANEEDVVVEQCTGLKDKNGKLIFEGDIVRARNPSKTVYDKLKVTYEIFRSAFMMSNGNKLGNYLGVFFDKDWCWDIEVIGNIHENPELLEILDDNTTN